MEDLIQIMAKKWNLPEAALKEFFADYCNIKEATSLEDIREVATTLLHDVIAEQLL